MDYKIGMYCLLFTYGFVIAYHLMGMTKYCSLNEFDWKKAGLGVINEFGFVVFWLLICAMPNFINLDMIGLDVNLNDIVNVIMFYPLIQSIKRAYDKAMEVKCIDISEVNKKD